MSVAPDDPRLQSGNLGGEDPAVRAILESADAYSPPNPYEGFGTGLEQFNRMFGAMFGGGGGGGGGGKNILNDPKYWQFREELLGQEKGLIGKLEDLARQGKGLTEEEAQLRRANIKRIMELAAQQTRDQTQQQVRGLGNEAAARGSFMSQSRILGQQDAKSAEKLALQDLHERAKGQVNMLNIGLQEAALSLQEQLARLQAQKRQAEIEHNIELLRKP